MTELRTTLKIPEAEELLSVIALLLTGIDPAIRIVSETVRGIVLVSILFPDRKELELFRSALEQKGIELARWGEHEADLTGAEEPLME